MNLRWAIAAFGALALAFVTVPAPWPDSHAGAAGPACPANAKPANMNFTFKDLEQQGREALRVQRQGRPARFLGDVVRPVQDRDPVVHRIPGEVRQERPAGHRCPDRGHRGKLKPFAAEMKMNYPCSRARPRRRAGRLRADVRACR